MFDNLKEKLGSFRKDAEEAAEENVEEIEDVEDLDEEELDEKTLEADAAIDEGDAEAPAADDVGATADEREVVPEEPDADRPMVDAAAEPEARETTGEATAETATAGVDRRADADPQTETEAAAAADAAAEPDPTAEFDADSGADLDSEGASDLDLEDAADAEGATGADEAIADAEEADTDEGAADDESVGGIGFGRKAKSLVRGKFVIEEEDLEDPLDELELALLSSDVEMGVAQEIIDNIRDELVGETRTFTTSTGDVVEEALRDAIYDVISVGQFDFDERIAVEDKPVTIVFTGVNGVGKTTSIAKLSRYFEERGYSTVMANGDTYRAGANEQIREHADALDTKLISHEQGGDPAAVLYDAVEYAEANDVDVVLGDTAGRLHTNEGLMDQLEKIDRVVGPDMTLFVDEAVAGQDAVNRAREFDEAAEIDGAILTKADADSNGGAAISIAHVTGKPILFLGVGQGYDDLERFDPEEMADRLLTAEE
ncbi:signal recognition particle-docking protein FtsY [Halosolutus gelatinilyticus]|uniref:signal recognition particle-docking protein FtsY n=1 Tax=Halosolutus gelatinilyticus TaxID=2931975 RepID=UPI001FF1EF41|nr:signal recognition particle-docking protein FtsY [Halosolutus gelatinilyticus]